MTTGRDPRDFDPNYDPDAPTKPPPRELLIRQGTEPRRIRSWLMKLIPLAVLAVGVAVYLMLGG